MYIHTVFTLTIFAIFKETIFTLTRVFTIGRACALGIRMTAMRTGRTYVRINQYITRLTGVSRGTNASEYGSFYKISLTGGSFWAW